MIFSSVGPKLCGTAGTADATHALGRSHCDQPSRLVTASDGIGASADGAGNNLIAEPALVPAGLPERDAPDRPRRNPRCSLAAAPRGTAGLDTARFVAGGMLGRRVVKRRRLVGASRRCDQCLEVARAV